MNDEKIEELALYMLSRLPAHLDAKEDSTAHYMLRAVAAGITKANEEKEKESVKKLIKSLDGLTIRKGLF